eukprot:s1378_g2.t1
MCAVYLRESYIYDGMGTRVLSLATLTCPECAGKSSSFTLPFASASSFGFGGVNAHVILEALAAPAKSSGAASLPAAPSPPPSVLPAAAVPTLQQQAAPALSVEDARQLIRRIVQTSLEEAAPDNDVTLVESGLDSLAAVQLRNTLQKDTQQQLPSLGLRKLSNWTSCLLHEAMAEYLASLAPPAAAATAPAVLATAPVQAAQSAIASRAEASSRQLRKKISGVP